MIKLYQMIHFGVKMSKKVNKNNCESFLSELFLFNKLTESEVKTLLSDIEVEVFEFQQGETIYSPEDFKTKVGFIISGECSVEKEKHDGTNIPLNTLRKGDSFGILAVFSENERFPTVIKAKKHSEVVFFDKDTICFLIKKYPEISMSIITFMSDKIEFLNKKIATFSADSVEEKFAFYILSEYQRTASLSFSLNLSKVAKTLNAGRASVYRAIDHLKSLSLITFENKKNIYKRP